MVFVSKQKEGEREREWAEAEIDGRGGIVEKKRSLPSLLSFHSLDDDTQYTYYILQLKKDY